MDETASPGDGATTLGGGTAISGGGTPDTGCGTPFQPVPAEFNHCLLCKPCTNHRQDVCLPVCLSHAGTEWKRRQLRIAQGLSIEDIPSYVCLDDTADYGVTLMLQHDCELVIWYWCCVVACCWKVTGSHWLAKIFGHWTRKTNVTKYIQPLRSAGGEKWPSPTGTNNFRLLLGRCWRKRFLRLAKCRHHLVEKCQYRRPVSSFQLGWVVYAGQRLRPQHGPVSHLQKIPSKYWVLKICGRNSKIRNYPHSHVQVDDQIILLRPSDYSSPKENGYCHVQHVIHGIHGPP